MSEQIGDSSPIVESREELVERLQRTERLTTMAKLVSSIAHELGTPLNVIAGRAMMIASGEVSGDESISSAKTIVEQANRMTQIIRQMLSCARRPPSQRTPVAVSALLRKTISVVGPRAEKSNVQLMIDPESEELTLRLEETKFLLVITTFVLNSIDAMPKGGRVLLGARKETRPPRNEQIRSSPEYYSIYVRDSGSGIAKEDIPHIFKPFFKTNEETKGTGLGLAIAQGIVRDHGGWIDVESELGAGSTFKVCLPEGGVTCKPDAS